MRYKLEISEEQATIIKIALEEYFRLRMNQTKDFADSLCLEDFDFEDNTGDDFNERLRRRDFLREELKHLLDYAHPMMISGRYPREKTAEMKRAQDIWKVIRYRLWTDRNGEGDRWCVDGWEPRSTTGEPLPKMEAIGGKGNG